MTLCGPGLARRLAGETVRIGPSLSLQIGEMQGYFDEMQGGGRRSPAKSVRILKRF
jgi:hypothetical protein